jgi:hypothetical protein
MRALICAGLLAVAGCGNDSIPPADMAAAGPDMTVVLSGCGHPGDKGNSKGVGKFCVQNGDCTTAGLSTNICSALGNGAKPSASDTYFCTIYPCHPDGGVANECGDNATCACGGSSGGSGCACTPNTCLGR